MEYNELQLLWNKYDNKLDKLNKLDNQIIVTKLLNQKQRRIKSVIRENKFSLLCYILVFAIIAISGIGKVGNMNWKIILGTSIILFSIIEYYLFTLKRNKILKGIELKTDTIKSSIDKLISYPKTRFNKLRHVIIFSPVYLIGITLLMWDKVRIDSPDPKDKVLFFITVYFIGSLIGIPFYIMEKRKINSLIKELHDLNDEEL